MFAALSAVFSADTWRLEARVWVLVVAGFAATMTFMTTPWLALGAVLGVTAVVYAVASNQPLRLAMLPFAPWLLSGLACSGYLLMQLGWSAEPRATALCAVIVTILLAAIHVLYRTLPSFPQDWLEHLTRSILVAFIIGVLFLLSEELSDHAMKRFLFWPFQAFRSTAGTWTFDQAVKARINLTSVKWNMPAVTFLLWPVLLIARCQLGASSFWLKLLLLCATGWLVLLSDHKTSIPALIFGLAVFLMALVHRRATRLALTAVWLAAFVIVIPVVHAMYSHGVQREARVAPTLAARIYLWEATAHEFRRHPVLGVGANASDLVVSLQGEVGRLDRQKAGNPPHAHNIYLQSLSELGVAGTALLALFGLFVLRGIGRSGKRAQPYLLAAFATVIATATASFGLFEPWFMSAIALSAMVARIAAAYGSEVESAISYRFDSRL